MFSSYGIARSLSKHADLHGSGSIIHHIIRIPTFLKITRSDIYMSQKVFLGF
jgi:hypothetical protein